MEKHCITYTDTNFCTINSQSSRSCRTAPEGYDGNFKKRTRHIMNKRNGYGRESSRQGRLSNRRRKPKKLHPEAETNFCKISPARTSVRCARRVASSFTRMPLPSLYVRKVPFYYTASRLRNQLAKRCISPRLCRFTIRERRAESCKKQQTCLFNVKNRNTKPTLIAIFSPSKTLTIDF